MHLYANISHIYFVTNDCGATILQAYFATAFRNLLLGSNIGSNNKKYMDNDSFMHKFTTKHQLIQWYVYVSISGQVTHYNTQKYK